MVFFKKVNIGREHKPKNPNPIFYHCCNLTANLDADN
jgi:hypothetical protein